MIPPTLLEAYHAQVGPGNVLLAELENLVSSRDRRWFYSARLKSLESFAQKIESGRFRNYSRLEDFVAAMIVVPMLGDVPAAHDFVSEFFDVKYRRPVSSVETKKKSSDFHFDDLRLYGHLRPAAGLPERPIDGLIFEIQIKTFLQHAWSIATHDLVYKHDDVSWARSRVAYQVKALLEHADLSVSSIALLERSSELPTTGQPEERLRQLIRLVRGEWEPDVLPLDLRRLAENLDRLMSALAIGELSALSDLLAIGKREAGGQHPLGLSPYQCVVDYASVFRAGPLRKALTRSSDRAPALLVTLDVLQRLGLQPSEAPNALL